MSTTKQDIIQELRRDIMLLQGFKPPTADTVDPGLGPVTAAFPNGVFPTGAIHEFLSSGAVNAAATGGFAAALAAPLMARGGACVWISCDRKVFPPALKAFGIEPEQVIFVDLKKEKQALWAMEEALKCEGLAAVVGELREISLTASRRLQLAVEHSRVTGLLLRHDPRQQNTVACVARWRITPLPTEPEANMPGIGFPRWNVELSRVRNGRPGVWQMEWSAGRFRPIARPVPASRHEQLRQEQQRKTG